MKLKELVATDTSWQQISETMSRSYVVCRYRWLYLLSLQNNTENPNLTTDTTLDESVVVEVFWFDKMVSLTLKIYISEHIYQVRQDFVLKASISMFGRNWYVASQIIGDGVTPNQCHSRFRAIGTSDEWQQMVRYAALFSSNICLIIVLQHEPNDIENDENLIVWTDSMVIDFFSPH